MGAQGWGAKRAQASARLLVICKQFHRYICKLLAALRALARSQPIPGVLALGHLSFLAFRRQLDRSRLWILLMPGNYFLLDSNPALLVEKGREFVLDEYWREVHSSGYLGCLQTPRTDLWVPWAYKQQFRTWPARHLLRETFPAQAC